MAKVLESEYWSQRIAVQWTLKNILWHHSSKVSILQCSTMFMIQLSHPHITTGKAIALTRWTFVSKVMSLLFNMLSRFVITFLLVIIFFVITFFSKKQVSFNFMAAVTISSDFGAWENKFCYYFHCFPNYLPWSDGTQICGLLISLLFVLAGASLIWTDLNWATVFFQ